MKCHNCNSENPDDSRFCGNCGKSLIETPTTPPTAVTQRMAPRASVDFRPGQHFGTRYQIVEKIGQGGMGVVYKAIDKEISRVVALKMIRPEFSLDPAMVEQFKRELILAREISHEHVIRIHDLGEEGGIRYISMKYIDGTNLWDLLRATGRLTGERVVSIAEQICAALGAAHRKGVVHRDLKPQNIMIDRGGDVQVMDFGIARSLESSEVSGADTVTGTPSYMSPEQAQGKPGDARSDIYSLGCILYEMLTGRKVFESETADGLMARHISETPTPPSALNSAVTSDLDSLILKALEKEPEKRFQTADDLCAALQGVPALDHTPVDRRPDDHTPAPDFDTSATKPAPGAKTSIAVLPFRDMSPEKDQEYFCDGMAEEIINALVRIEGLHVAALTSAFQFKNQSLDIRKIGEQLNVGTVLEGSVRKAGKRLRVTAQLVKVADGYHVWSERYDRDLEDVFEIQDQISEAIVRALEPRLIEKKRRPAAKREVNLEAYNLYLKGRYHWNRRRPEEIRKAIDYLNQAVEIDPDYALAHAGLADCYIMLDHASPTEIYAMARDAATRALELDDTLAEPHTTLAWIAGNAEYDWETAEREFKTSIELNPNYATGHQWYAIILSALRRSDEAFREIETAKRLDPLSLIIKVAAGVVYSCAGEYDRAIAEARSALDMDPDFWPAHSVLASVYSSRGMFKESTEEVRILFNAIGGPGAGDSIEQAFNESGLKGSLLKLIDCMASDDFSFSFVSTQNAVFMVLMGEPDKAIALLEKAFEAREQELLMIAVMPDFAPLRSHPGFQDLLRRMNLPLE